uniref:Uncharacterized protein n=1 Tax=Rhizophora mucronata TaxID=61149 RepID=A0A2P2L2H0_RHIMU
MCNNLNVQVTVDILWYFSKRNYCVKCSVTFNYHMRKVSWKKVRLKKIVDRDKLLEDLLWKKVRLKKIVDQHKL